MLSGELMTKDDLQQFKSELLNELKQFIRQGGEEPKQWLRSNQVRKRLNISPGTLQNLRINGTLRSTKVGGILYYKSEDIDKLLNGGLK